MFFTTSVDLELKYIFLLKTHVLLNLLLISDKPIVSVDCPRLIMVNVGDNITCLCEGKGGFPPADVTWYKDDTQIGDIKKEQNTLTLKNIDRTDSGTYKCVGQSHTLKDEKTVEPLFYGRHLCFIFLGYLNPCKRNTNLKLSGCEKT